MGIPNDDQIKGILDRAGTVLREWDDTRFFLVIQDREGRWAYTSRGSGRDAVEVARGLLGEALCCIDEEEQTDVTGELNTDDDLEDLEDNGEQTAT